MTRGWGDLIALGFFALILFILVRPGSKAVAFVTAVSTAAQAVVRRATDLASAE